MNFRTLLVSQSPWAKPLLANSHCLGRASASLLKLVRLSAPSWFKMLGSISVSCFVSAWPVMVKVFAARDAWTLGLLKWITVPWFVNIFTSSIPEILFTPNFFKENWSFLSSAVAVLWTTFFFLRAVPYWREKKKEYSTCLWHKRHFQMDSF